MALLAEIKKIKKEISHHFYSGQGKFEQHIQILPSSAQVHSGVCSCGEKPLLEIEFRPMKAWSVGAPLMENIFRGWRRGDTRA